jgi:hypothetical protein
MVSNDLMSDVDECVDEKNSLEEDPTTWDELNEVKVNHDPFEFPHDDEIPFSRLLSNMMVWQVQRSNNGDTNSNMPLLNDDVQVFDALPLVVHAPIALNQDTFM